jgi:hypothetical protein
MNAMPANPPKLSLKERMARKPLRDVYEGAEDLWGYRAAAATLCSFIAEGLRPFNEESSPERCERLLKECDLVSFGDAPKRWSLRLPVRQTMLVRLFEQGLLMEALRTNPKMDSSATQRIFERCLNLSVERPYFLQTLENAAAALEVSYWLQPIEQLRGRLPTSDSLRQFIAREQLLEPFRTLVGGHFAGRTAELNALSDYVGVLESSSLTKGAVRRFEEVFSLVKSPPLFLLGPGGVGKSTLIAQFVLQHIDAYRVPQFPFAYLDFDRTALMAEEPITLLFEVMRQLAVQYSDAKDRYRAIVQHWGERVRAEDDAREYETSEGMVVETASPFVTPPQNGSLFMKEFVDFVQQLDPQSADQPMLLVLDTFEEVQFRSSASEDDVFNLLEQMQGYIPRLRTVICGRTEITSTLYKVKEQKIGNFDKEAAIAFLGMHGIEETVLAARIVAQVGTSPLVLRLAADVARREDAGSGGIEGLRSRWLDIFVNETVEVVLYKRILAHVYDERVQRLANPGLVVRFITPEVLLGILGPACDVSIEGIADARGLVSTMRKQLTTILVPHGGTDKLAHRPDMRTILLADLTARSRKEKETFALLQKIHRMAVDFYGKYEDDESRAEEIFHRLWLNQERSVLKARWRDEAGPYIGSSILELSPQEQAFVAARAGFEVAEDIWNKAHEEDWALLAARRIKELVRLGKPQDASALLIQTARKVSVAPSNQPYAGMIEETLSGYARHYELTRSQYKSGDHRTSLMDGIVEDVRDFARSLQLDSSNATTFFSRNTEGDRVVGLAIAQSRPNASHIQMAIGAIGDALTPFEQYHGLVLAAKFEQLSYQSQAELREALLNPTGVQIHSSDRSRWTIAQTLLNKFESISDHIAGTKAHGSDNGLAVPGVITCIEIKPPFSSPSYDDPEEHHGPWLGTQMKRSLHLPGIYRLGRDLVTNAEFIRFVDAGCYQRDEFWPGRIMSRARPLLAAYRKSSGPAGWLQGKPPQGKDAHPVTGVCYYEAAAFVAWMQKDAPVENWMWTLPREDEWEFAARTENGLIYPWGNSFDPSRCNSIESGLGGTSEVDRFTAGASKFGCRDMAGNVWEFMLMVGPNQKPCVMRGGSFKNQRDEVRTYLRLTGVPRDHRPPDFGFRVGQKLISG